MVFAQNLGAGGVLRPGTQVDLHWDPEHTFGLDGDPATPTPASSGSRTRAGRGRLSRGAARAPRIAAGERQFEEPQPDRGRGDGPARAAGRRRATPYLLLLPGHGLAGRSSSSLPLLTLLATSMQTRPPGAEIGVYEQTFRFANYTGRRSTSTCRLFVRSFVYAVHRHRRSRWSIGYPLAYAIAFKAGPLEEPAAGAGDRAVLHQLPAAHHRVEADPRRRGLGRHHAARRCTSSAPQGHIINTAPAVVIGLTYNFLPFMTLPIYASLERVDLRLHRGGRRPVRQRRSPRIRKVTFPLSMPGVVAGTLLTFIPAAGDYVNARAARRPRTRR